jgi:AcrR family transcriptional regulator
MTNEKMTGGFLPPQQQRSRETLARLLQATIETLEEHGLDGATIPRIAGAAGVAPASVYRRFRDRNALYRAALLDALEKSAAASRKTLRLESFKDRTLEGVVARLVAITVQQYRLQPGLMRALTRFIENDSNEDFRANALAIVSGNYERIIDMLLAFRTEITHPNPRRAIIFGLLTMATIIEVRALEKVSMWNELLPVSDKELKTEVTKNFLAYLRSPSS